MFDVKTMLTEEAQKSWTEGRWNGKITIHDFVPAVKSLGRLATTEDIDAYVASAKAEDLDKPLTAAEIKERFHGQKMLMDMPVTRESLRWLRDQKVNGRPANEDFGVWRAMKTRAGKEGQQLELALVQALFATITKVMAVEAFGPDTSVPDYSVGGTFSCTWEGCGGSSVPQVRTLVDPNGQSRKHEDGPLEGEDLRVGDFLIRRGQNGSWEIQPLCREHRQLAVKAGNTTYPFRDAEVIVNILNAQEKDAKDADLKRQRDFAALKELAARSPAVAQRQRNQDVRRTVENNRTTRRR